MPKLLRLFLLLTFLSLIALPSSALDNSASLQSDSIPDIQQDESDSAAVRVIPNEAEVGSNHTILVTGLSANEEVTVRIVFDEDDNRVYQTRELADSRGIVEVSIFTEISDTAGDYTIEVLNNSDDVIGSASLTLLEASTFNADISVAPLEAEAGTTFVIEITDVRPFAILDVSIDNEDGEEVFTQRLRASVDGNATIEFESSDTTTGDLNIVIIEGETTRISELQITVLEQLFPATIVIEPADALPGDTVFVTISGLDPERNVLIDVSFDDETIASIEETSNVSGLVIFPFTFEADTELGRYIFSVIDGDTLVGRERLRVDIPPANVTITPPVGTVGTTFLVTVAGLRPDEAVIIDLTQNDEVIQSFTATADENGDARAGLGQRIDLELGIYGVQVTRLDQVVFTAPVEVAEERPPTPITINPDDINVSVSPESGVIPTEYTLLVEGLPADTNITLFILLDGQSVLSLSGVADENGSYTTVINSEASDPAGIYTLEVRAEGNVIGSFDFEIANEDTQETPDDEDTSEAPPSEISGDVSLRISPETLRQGERIEFFINNLMPDETVIFELSFDGDVIYTTESIADSNGAAAVALLAANDEALGDYQVRILRDDEALASNDFVIVDSEAVISQAAVSVTPETGSAGTDYAIVVTGLAPEETITVTVSFDGEAVFEDERTADSEGIVTVVLSSDSSDELGAYDVTVSRDGDELSTTLTITEGDSDTALNNTDAPTLVIAPDTGLLGTDHDVSVTGLNANEDFTLVIEYDGEAVYSAEQTADEDGKFSTVISTADSDPLGDYTISIQRDDADNISKILSVVSDGESASTDSFEVSIDKDEVNEQEPFEVTVSGLSADETVTIEVVFDGEVVFETERSADDDGVIVLALSTDEGDPTGTYSINVLRGDQAIRADVIVRGTEEVTSVDNDVQIRVSPDSGEIGTEYEFIVTGLESNETFELAVGFDDEIVFEDTRTADVSGIFTITLETSDSDEAGEYTFSIIRENGTVNSVAFIVEDGESNTNVIPDESENSDTPDADVASSITTYADAVRVEFDSDTSVQVVEFDGQAGDVISVTVDSNDSVDTIATLFNPDGEEIASDDDGGVGFDPEIERAVLAETGTYTLEIRTFTAGDTGDVQVTISRNDVRTLDEEEVRTVVLNSKVTTDILTFEGQAGDVISLVIELESGNIGAFVVSAQQNDARLMNYETFGLPQSITLGFVVPEDGNVTISIQDDGTGNAIINARISRE